MFLWVNEDPFVDELSALLVVQHGSVAAVRWSSQFLSGWSGFGCPLKICEDCTMGVVIAQKVGLEDVGVGSNDLLEGFPVSFS